MTQNEKDLLIKDLCSRLPYGVILNCCNIVNETLTLIDYKGLVNNDYDIDEVKPYLFPLSNMTEEQFQELNSFNLTNCAHSYEVPFKFRSVETFSLPILEWFLKHHFDINGLLEKDLAINSIGLNIY